MRANGLVTRERGGDVQVLSIANPDQLTLFRRGQIDAAWAPEPWAARLVHDGGGRIFIDERDLWPNRQFAITELIVSPKFLKAASGYRQEFPARARGTYPMDRQKLSAGKTNSEPAVAKGDRETSGAGSSG